MTRPECRAHRSQDGRCTWTVWAPKAGRVELMVFDADAGPAAHTMSAAEFGHFHCALDRIAEGTRYAFRLDGGPPRPDPASRWQPDGVHAPSAVWSADAYRWSDGAWRGAELADLVVYELHVGAFTPEGSFDSVAPRLDALRELGVTAIELMPVGQFPGRRDWGYNGAFWYAVQNSYGGPRGLQRLVDACHARGLAVILDVVYNHFGPEGCYLGEYAPYFTDRHATPWGSAVNFDDAGCEGVRSFVLDNVRHWIRDFHIDGLRLDAVHAIYDDSRPHILAEIKLAATEEERRLGRPVHVIAESNLNDVWLLNSPAQGGCGLDAQWSDDFHHCVHALLTGERDGYYVDFSDPPRQLVKALNDIFVYDGSFSRFLGAPHGRPIAGHGGEKFVVSIQTHDQVGNRARGERLHVLVEAPAQRLAAGLLLLAPHVPMLFMGEEYGERIPFPFFCDFGDPELKEAVRRGRCEEFAAFAWSDEVPDPNLLETFQRAILTWDWLEGTPRAGLRRLYRDLLTLRREQPALHDFRRRAARLIDGDSQCVLTLKRGEPDRPARRLWAVFNLGDAEASISPPDWDECRWLLRSDAARYGGTSDESPATLFVAPRERLRPREFAVFAPDHHRQPE